MKKIITILLVSVMLISLAVPTLAFSEIGKDEETGECYEEFTFYFDEFGWNAIVVEGKCFNIETNFYFDTTVVGGGDGNYIRIYAKEDNNVVIKRAEARIWSYGDVYDKVKVAPGDKREKEIKKNSEVIVHIDNIDDREFTFGGGTDYVAFDLIRVYYECAGEHIWDENGRCKYCGIDFASYVGTLSLIGTVLSQGHTGIVCGLSGLAVGFIAVLLIFRKKKRKSAMTGGTVNKGKD